MDRNVAVTNREDSAVEGVKTSALDFSGDGASGVAKWASQLAYGDDAMLSLGEHRKRVMAPNRAMLPSFAPHTDSNEGNASFPPPTQPFFRPIARR
jgi:hypothetical protein